MEGINNKKNSSIASLLGSTVKKDTTKRSKANTAGAVGKSRAHASFESILTETKTDSALVELLDENGNVDEIKLSELQDAIHTAGEYLLSKPGIDSVLAYRHQVQRLLTSVVPLLHRKEQFTDRQRVGNSFTERKFTFIHTVNEKLDRLLRIVVSSQARQMNIMKALDEIRGLIVNILH